MKPALLRIGIIALLALVAGFSGLLFISRRSRNAGIPQETQVIAPPPAVSPTQQPRPTISVSLSASADTVAAGQNVTVAVSVNAATEIFAMDTELLYDTRAFRFVSAKPAALFRNVQVFKEDSQAPGVFFSSLGSFTPASGEGTVLEVTFTALSGASQGTITLGDKTVAAVAGGVAARIPLPVTRTVRIVEEVP